MKKLIFVLLAFCSLNCSGDDGGVSGAAAIVYLGIPVISLGLTLGNLHQMSARTDHVIPVPVLGILFGTASAVMGVSSLSGSNGSDAGGTLSLVIGAATVGTSIANLCRRHPSKDVKISWNLYPLQMQDHNKSAGIGFTINRVF